MSVTLPAAELVPRTADPADPAERIRAAVARAVSRRSVVVLGWRRAPAPPPAWRPGGAFHLAVPPALDAVGEAWRVELHGGDACAELRRALDGLWDRVELLGDAPARPPRVYGGLAFDRGGADEPEWSGFGDGLFVLPRWTWDGETLRFAVDGATADANAAEAAIAELEAWSEVGRREEPRRDVPPCLRVEHADEAAWWQAVRSVQDDIASGHVAKVVLARRSTARFAAPVDPAAVLARLRERYPDCTCFAFGRGDAAFVGATPERLFQKRGSVVRTEALAGSVDARAPDAAARLLASAKDRAEHRFVVDDVMHRLAPLCEELRAASSPEVRALRHVLHMRTPIEGRARADVHAVDLLAALHPTPAVGGVPAAEALGRIRRLERAPRGWYSGPIGWIDAQGDAEIAVALRSGLLCGDRAWLYAGAGIVRDSDAHAEWDETSLKMRALLEALGGGP